MSAITTLEALRDAIRASTGPDRELDAAFAELVLGLPAIRVALHYTHPLAGPGALFAAARERQPNTSLALTYVASTFKRRGAIGNHVAWHPLLTHALALAMTKAAIQERDNG